MKRITSIVIAAVLVFSASLVLFSCGKSDSVVGKWEMEIDYAALLGLESDTNVKAIIDFKDDGTYTVSIDEEQMKAVIKEMFGSFLDEDAMEEQLEDTETEQAGNYTYENGTLTMDEATFKCELTSDTLTFTEVSGTEDDNAIMNSSLLPMTLTRVK